MPLIDIPLSDDDHGIDEFDLSPKHAVRRLQQNHDEKDVVVYPDHAHEPMPDDADLILKFMQGL